MPVEIKELIIRATVRDSIRDSIRDSSDRVRVRAANTGAASGEDAFQEERIVNRCVEQIMNILRIQNER